MHIRTMTKSRPAAAFNVEQILFVLNGFLGVVNTVIQTGNSAVILAQNLGALLKPQA